MVRTRAVDRPGRRAAAVPRGQAALAQGWAVVLPDHQGPNAAYAAGPLAGRITLDGIRAAENFDPSVCPAGRPRSD
ncbi:lipase family protein [Rhodococcus sp. USK10]|uniref:lipase family protein n=1 Tax=Rhodococcus sp. USK10 TaxID=2789739 RepID=UPI0035B54EB7